MNKRHLVKDGAKIIGFVYTYKNETWFAFGKPSQPSYISFRCKDVEEGINKIKEYSHE